MTDDQQKFYDALRKIRDVYGDLYSSIGDTHWIKYGRKCDFLIYLSSICELAHVIKKENSRMILVSCNTNLRLDYTKTICIGELGICIKVENEKVVKYIYVSTFSYNVYTTFIKIEIIVFIKDDDEVQNYTRHVNVDRSLYSSSFESNCNLFKSHIYNLART